MTVSSSVRRNIGFAALFSLLLALLPVGPSVTVASASTGALTVPSTGGDTAPSANWTYDASTGVLSVTGTASIAASYLSDRLDDRNLTIQAASITIDGNVVATTGSSSLTLTTTGDIDVKPARSLTTQGGNISLHADSDGDGAGGIRIGIDNSTDSLLTSNGGDISLAGGGSGTSGSGNTGFAGLSSFSQDAYLFSIGVLGATVDAGGGDIVVKGYGGSVNTGLVWCVQVMDTLQTSGSGTVLINGDCGSTPANATANNSRNSIGTRVAGTVETATGAIDVIGRGNVARTNARGISMDGTIQSASGPIVIRDETANTSHGNYTGAFLYGVNLGQGTLGSSSSNISIYADEFVFRPNVNTTGTLTVAPAASDFQAPLTILAAGSISNVSGITLGSVGNTENIVIEAGFTVGGTLTIFSNGAVSQSAAVTATSLSLNGSGSFTLTNTSNNFGTIAGGASGSKLGSVSIYDASGGLTIGTVGSLEGITATGDVLVETGAGDITLAKNIATDSTSSSAITLNAGDSTAAGTSTGGNIVVSGSPTLTTGANGIVRLFSGSESGSTGLTTLAGGASNVYYGVDESSTLSPSLSAGTTYALYRAYEACSPSEATYSSTGVSYKVLAFKNSSLCEWAVPAGVTAVDLLVVGGGGAGGGLGGGGAGEFLERTSIAVSGAIAVVAGSGGSATGGATASVRNGQQSTFGSITASGGGGGGYGNGGSGAAGASGASGGGAARGDGSLGATADDGDATSFGNNGAEGWGFRNPTVGGAGGGAGGAAVNATSTYAVDNALGEYFTGTYPDGDAGVVSQGGVGKATSMLSTTVATSLNVGEVAGSSVYFAGGGGGGCGGTGAASGCSNASIAGGLGGGGNGSSGAGTSYTGGGGAGSNVVSGAGGAGGSGIVLVRFVNTSGGSGSGGAGGSSSNSSSNAVASPPLAPVITPRQTRLSILGPNTNPVPRPVERLGLRFDPDAPSRATVGGAPVNLVKTPVGSDGLSVTAGAFQFGVSLADADGAEVQTDTPSRSPELFVPRGQSAAVSGKGSYPGSFVQLFLPGNGNDSRELARIPVRSDGTFASDLSFQAGALVLPVPIGRQVLQVVGYDELGNQTVVDMTVNIGQGVPAPEPNRQAGALPALTAGQSLATSGGIPETVSVTGVPEAGNVVVEGSGWVINVNADRDNGVVENADGNVLVRLNPSSVGTTSGNGFLPGTLATVWLFSEPTLVATVSVNDAGEFSAEFLVDARLIAPGEHTLQVQGVGSDGYIKAANLGVLVEEPVELTTESASGLLWWVVGAFVLALLFLLVLLARRRRSQEQ